MESTILVWFLGVVKTLRELTIKSNVRLNHLLLSHLVFIGVLCRGAVKWPNRLADVPSRSKKSCDGRDFLVFFLYMRSMTLEIPALPCWSTQTDWLEISQRLKERDNLKCWCKRRLSEIKNYDVRVAKFPVFLFALVTISCTTCSQLFRFIAALFFDISSLFSNWDVCSDFWSLSGQFASQITFVLATDDIILPWIHNVFF